MSICKPIKFYKPEICLGDLRYPMELYRKAIVNPMQVGFQNVDYGIEEISLGIVWTALKNIKGDALADSVSRSDLPTHWIYMRYQDNISTENAFIFKSFRYNILRVENMSEDDTILQIQALKTGITTMNSSKV